MKLYSFELNDFRTLEIKRTVLDVEEKPKTYITKKICSRRIRKEDIGKIVGTYTKSVVLKEDDFEKAKKLFLEMLTIKVDVYKKRISNIEDEIIVVQRNIEKLKKYQIQNMEE